MYNHLLRDLKSILFERMVISQSQSMSFKCLEVTKLPTWPRIIDIINVIMLSPYRWKTSM